MAAVVLLTAFFICQAQSQICPGPLFPGQYGSCDSFIPNIPSPCPCGPLLNNLAQPFIPPCNNYVNPVLPCAQPIVEVPVLSSVSTPCNTVNPVVATTIVDNTLANSLANAIQLLIVSNLIENTLGSSCNGVLSSCIGIPETYEVVKDFYPNQILPIYDPPCYNPCSSFEPLCYQEPVMYPPYDTCNNGFGYGIGEYGYGFDNYGPNYGIAIDTCNPCNQIGGYGIPAYGDLAVAPVAVEVPFPASIPAQLLCNFGYMPTNVPCVSVNVEPLPLNGCGCNPFGNVYF